MGVKRHKELFDVVDRSREMAMEIIAAGATKTYKGDSTPLLYRWVGDLKKANTKIRATPRVTVTEENITEILATLGGCLLYRLIAEVDDE